LIEDERALGRRVPWAFPGGRLTIHPHYGYGENAWYDRDAGALCFLSFDAADDGRRVHTCLSHDIVVHELGHAVLDGMKPLYNEVDGPDVAGFHEYFGDALAMSSALTMREVLLAVVRDRPQRLSARNVVSDIALEFGTAANGEGALRSGANTKTMRDVRGSWEEHDYSEVLSGVFNDVLVALYEAEIPRALEARRKRTIDGQVAMHALIKAARQTSRMMLRAIDYLPPAGMTYLDYARAVHRADEVAYPVDDRGYRRIVADAFRRRGVVRSRKDAAASVRLQNDAFRAYDVDRLAGTKTDAYVFLDANRETLGIPRDVNFAVTGLHRTRKRGPSGYYSPREIVIEYVWDEEVALDGRRFGGLNGATFTLWCGGTLVFDADGNVLHSVVRAGDAARRKRLRAYVAYLVEEGLLGDDEHELSLPAARRTHRLTATVERGCVRVVRNPALRHEGRRR
ncbi:MAG: hypothetical protein ACF8XB_10470, partial [Planctomycetota bacterium JB042]